MNQLYRRKRRIVEARRIVPEDAGEAAAFYMIIDGDTVGKTVHAKEFEAEYEKICECLQNKTTHHFNPETGKIIIRCPICDRLYE